MIIKQLRQEYSGNGRCNGPVEGITVVEIMATDKNGENIFFLIERNSISVCERLSKYPLFDISIHLTDSDVNFDLEFEKLEKVPSIEFETENVVELDEYDKEYRNLVLLARLAMKKCYNEDDSYESGQEFIKEYLMEDINEIELPEIRYCDETGHLLW